MIVTLTKADEAELGRQWLDQGDQAARTALVNTWRQYVARLARQAAKKFHLGVHGREDIEADGLVLMLDTIDRHWRPGEGRLSTIYTKRFWQMVLAARWTDRLVRVPATSVDLSTEEGRNRRDQALKTSVVKSADAIAERLGDRWHPSTAATQIDEVHRRELVAHLVRILRTLPPIEARVLWRRAHGDTLQQIGQAEGLTGARIAQLEKQATHRARQVAAAIN